MATAVIMGMPVTLEIVDQLADRHQDIETVFSYLRSVDERFSPFKSDSELERFNRGELRKEELSVEMTEVLERCQQTKRQTDGYFDIKIGHKRKIDPSGLVKGWAILKASQLLQKRGYQNFYLEIAGDIQLAGQSWQARPWRVGIRDPFQSTQVRAALSLTNCGVATSGTYLQGSHIYNPTNGQEPSELVSLTVIGPDIYEADRFATAAFAMGRAGLDWIESRPGFEAYAVTAQHQTCATSGFTAFSVPSRAQRIKNAR